MRSEDQDRYAPIRGSISFLLMIGSLICGIMFLTELIRKGAVNESRTVAPPTMSSGRKHQTLQWRVNNTTDKQNSCTVFDCSGGVTQCVDMSAFISTVSSCLSAEEEKCWRSPSPPALIISWSSVQHVVNLSPGSSTTKGRRSHSNCICSSELQTFILSTQKHLTQLFPQQKRTLTVEEEVLVWTSSSVGAPWLQNRKWSVSLSPTALTCSRSPPGGGEEEPGFNSTDNWGWEEETDHQLIH